MRIGKNTSIANIYVTWPHQVTIGNNCIIEHNCYFKFDGIWKQGPSISLANNIFVGFGCEFNIRKSISIGNDCLIASGCKFIDHDHGSYSDELMRLQNGPEKEIIIGEDVWLGTNVIVLKGCNIGNGAIIAAGAVVTKNVGKFEIWAGIPAKKVGNRK